VAGAEFPVIGRVYRHYKATSPFSHHYRVLHLCRDVHAGDSEPAWVVYRRVVPGEGVDWVDDWDAQVWTRRVRGEDGWMEETAEGDPRFTRVG
jgi:hypothetical protein